jgi:hypothetical protein
MLVTSSPIETRNALYNAPHMSSLNLMLVAATVCALFAILLLLSVVRLWRRARDAAFFGMRQDARKSATRRGYLVLALSCAAVGLFAAREYSPIVNLLDLSPVPVAVAMTATPEAPTAEPTAIVTMTAELEPAPARATALPAVASSTLAAPSQRLTFHAVAAGITAKGEPIDEYSRFPARTQQVFVFFNYRDVPPRATIRHTWFHNGGSVHFDNTEFDGNAGAGVGSIVWKPDGGFEPGLYEVRIVLGNVPQFVANFEVR